MARSPRRTVKTPRIMAAAYRPMLARLVARGWHAPRERVSVGRVAIPLDPAALRHRVMPRTVHIIGAGLAGLSAAVRLIGRGVRVHVHEATAQAGGRCRSYHDLSLGMTIDNGNHLLLSGNRAALAYLDAIGARHLLIGPGERELAVRRSRDRRALDAARQRRRGAVVDFRSEPPRARHQRRLVFLAAQAAARGAGAPRSAT